MKRETNDEFKGILDAILDATLRVTAEWTKWSISPIPMTATTAACPPPVPGAAARRTRRGGRLPRPRSGGPKYGVTARHVLRAAGVNVDLSPAEAAARLSDPAWAGAMRTSRASVRNCTI